MQKVRATEWRSTAVGLLLLAAIACRAAVAQQPTLVDVVETAKQSKLRDFSKSISDAYKPTTPVSIPPSPAGGAARVAVAPTPLPTVDAPMLRAIFGVNELLEAELVLDGQSHSVYSDDPKVDIGHWTHARIFQSGVLLTRAPLNQTQSSLLDTIVAQGAERLMSCGKLGLKKSHCLVLLAGKASSGINNSSYSGIARGPASAPLLPPLPLPR